MIDLRIDCAGTGSTDILRDQKSFRNISSVPPGYQADHILELRQILPEMKDLLDDTTVVNEVKMLANSALNHQPLTREDNLAKTNHVGRAMRNGYCDCEGQVEWMRMTMVACQQLKNKAREMKVSQPTQSVFNRVEQKLTYILEHNKT